MIELAPWLPFHEFIPVSFLAATVLWLITKSRLESVIFLVSEYLSMIPTYFMWDAWGLNPKMVFGSWVLNTVIIFGAQVVLWDYLARAHKEKKVDDKD